MPNLVTTILLRELERDFQQMGSCLVVTFDKLMPQQDLEIRGRLRQAGVRYRVVRNRLARRALSAMKLDLTDAFKGKCGVAIAQKEGAIQAAKVLREYIKKQKQPPIAVMGGVVEGQAFVGKAAEAIADLPDRHTIQTRLASVISGPARSVACIFNAVAGGLARCIQARVDKQAGDQPAVDGAGGAGAA
jgi:large subunit ribosomal protein L10